MTKIYVNTRERQIELEDKITECLKTLYELEEITYYEIKEITNCVDVLQNIVIENENRYEVE